MSYSKIIIRYMSGTGNSYRVATWLGKIAEPKGLESQVLSIDKSDPHTEVKDTHDILIGMVFPTHGFTVPWHMLKYVWRMPRRTSTHAFCVATRAGIKWGPLFIPGLSGTATFIISLLLALKGYHTRGSMSVDMPSNWFAVHPMQSRESHNAIINRAEHKTISFIDRVLKGQKVWLTLNNLYEIIGGTLLSLISILYLFAGRFFLAKLFFANNNCNGCRLCADNCPVEAIKMWGTEHPRPFWKYNCESCMRCAAFCPHNAIEAGQSWGVILYFITTIPVGVYLFSWLNEYIQVIENSDRYWIHEIMNLLYYYPAIFISYFIFTWLIQLPAINWLFTHTTMTHFWGRYREPDTRIKHLAGKEER